MANFKCILIIRTANKVLFQINSSGKYELISVEQDVSLDRAKEYVQRTYKLEISDCQELVSCTFPGGRTYYICVDKPALEPPYGQKWFTLLTAAGKLPDEDTYHVIKDFLRHQAELSNVQLQFGLREGKIVAVGELFPEERGLKCGCVCPVCAGALVARLGTKKQAHFAHYKATDCDVASAQQTALHLLAKELISEARGMFFPAAMVHCQEAFSDEYEVREITRRLPKALEYRLAGFYSCSNVILEKKISDIIPDIILVQDEQLVLVEIAVTHFIDEEKQKKIEELGLSVLEVDLSDLRAEELNRKELQNRLLNTPEKKTWAYLPASQARQAAFDQYSELYKKAEQDIAAEEQQRIQKEKERAEKQEAAQQKYDQLIHPALYRETLTRRRDDKETFQMVRQFSFYHDQNYSGIPFFLDIPTTGDLVFACDRRIWQAAIFDRFIYNRNMEKAEPATVNAKRISSWVTNHQHFFKLDWELMSNVFSYAGGVGRQRSLLNQSIWEFLEHLAQLGFIARLEHSQTKLLVAHSIVPPNEDAAKALRQVLSKVDPYSPKASDFIRGNMKDFDRWQQEREERVVQAMRRAEAEKERQAQYEAGMQEILGSLPEEGFDGEAPLIDSYGHRWFLCTGCGSIVRDNDMSFYGGANGVNKGICRECNRRGQY